MRFQFNKFRPGSNNICTCLYKNIQYDGKNIFVSLFTDNF